MHLLLSQTGAITDGSQAVDLGQTPGEIIFLSAADSELAVLSSVCGEACGEGTDSGVVRLASLLNLTHNMSVDSYLEDTARHAKLIIVRILGGRGYWPYGVDELRALALHHDIKLALLPGDDQPDPELMALSTIDEEVYHRLWRYFVEGGPENIRSLICYAAHLTGTAIDYAEPKPLLRAGYYWPDQGMVLPDEVVAHWPTEQNGKNEQNEQTDRAVVAIVFYRAHLQTGNMAPVDALVDGLLAQGLNPLPVFAASLKDPACADFVRLALDKHGVGLILNTTSFALSKPGQARSETPFDEADCPVFQVMLAGNSFSQWQDNSNGLSARDIAMNVALPEVDGRILTRAISFKSQARFDDNTQCPIVRYEPVLDRVEFVAELTRNWIRLREMPNTDKIVALVLANYPNKDGRIANGVGLDTPQSSIEVLNALSAAGYDTGDHPKGGNALVDRVKAGPTNAGIEGRIIDTFFTLDQYKACFDRLPEKVKQEVRKRWGEPEQDPFFTTHEGVDGFALPLFRSGNILIGLQPARGYHIDPVSSYHDPDLVPPHGFFAFYALLRDQAQAVIHMGKHGSMEWLPGKALALSQNCYPEAVFGALPHIYPFIVNDPGEGSQAKRRAQAVIIDHLTPPLTRAESYGPLADLERLIDEYYQAAGVDPRRLDYLRREILSLTGSIGLDKDCGINRQDGEADALSKLDNYLCELKEMQIRDGLHIFGQAPQGALLDNLLVALTRISRPGDGAQDQSLLRALAVDLGLDFDPLDCVLAAPWTGEKPAALVAISDELWRINGDTVERLELLALALVSGQSPAPGWDNRGWDNRGWDNSKAVLGMIKTSLRPLIEQCGRDEINAIIRALDGKFVTPGASGAPTRGRLDVLPTGRNFYSLDARTVPTPAAWALGKKSAELLVTRFMQDHGNWPECLALSAWGTANMRTGGDDIAQMLALIGVKPQWQPASGRVSGFEIIPLAKLGRPRVDVTLRISGFFRDAFPAQIDLIDSAVRAVAQLDEPDDMNPLAAHFKRDLAAGNGSADSAQAALQAGSRIFGSKPGAYGAGLQALIDTRGWQDKSDLARAYIAWGGYAYGGGQGGVGAHKLFATRLAQTQAVIHNQDNREHDILDSDDYYQFEGGLAVAIEHVSGSAPALYHNDHSSPEKPVVRSLAQEISLVVRARAANPKWIAGVMRHGYKGAFEIAATVDYLFAFAATTGVVENHHFDALYDAYLNDEKVRDFLEQNNRDALKEITARLQEAIERGLWTPRRNSAYDHLQALSLTDA